jgi:uncharacterized protein YegL
MGTNLEQAVELIDRDPRQACVLLLDTSGSMQGERIAELNAGIQIFKDEVLKDQLAVHRVDLAIITFDSEVNVVRDFGGAIESFEPPRLTAQNQTFMGKAIIEALNKIEERKKQYIDSGLVYYRPWLFLITDGLPEGEPIHVIEAAKSRLHAAINEKKVAMFAVGVGEVDLSRLKDLAGTEPLRLKGTNFRELFKWLSVSVSRVSQSSPGDVVNLPPPNWASIQQ